MICKNCGAPVHGSICEYCNTDYSTFKQEDYIVKLLIDGEIREFYINEIENVDFIDSYRDNKGILRGYCKTKKKIHLTEV